MIDYWVILMDQKSKINKSTQFMMRDLLRCIFAEQPSSQLFPNELNTAIINLQKDNNFINSNNSFFTNLNVKKLKELTSKYNFKTHF